METRHAGCGHIVTVVPVGSQCGEPLDARSVTSVATDTFMAFVRKFAGDLDAAVAAGNVVIGDRLGLYRARPRTSPRPGRNWRRPWVNGPCPLS